MVASALDSNPRRLKHFLNLFRLRHYIAEATAKLPRGGTGGLTLPRLAKLVAIELRWLGFLDDVLASAELLGRVEATSSADGGPDEDRRVTWWRSKPELVHLLRWGVDRDATRFRLTKDDVEALFGIGGGGDRPNTTSAAPGRVTTAD